MIPIGRLPEGTRFYQPHLGISGTVIHSNECRVHVKIDGAAKKVTFESDGEEKAFVANGGRETDWTTEVPVEIEQ